ncbi:MAG: hypothetical protein ACRCT1_23680 [Microcoleaceae cyanobacterium]|jgi:hypothetical protein
MGVQGNSNAVSVKELVDQIFTSHRITRQDQQTLMNALLSKNSLTMEEHLLIDRVFDGLRRGLLRVVD